MERSNAFREPSDASIRHLTEIDNPDLDIHISSNNDVLRSRMLAKDLDDEDSFGSQVDSLFSSDTDANKSTKDVKGMYSSMGSFNSRVDSLYKSDSSHTSNLMRYSIKTFHEMTLPTNKKKLSPNATTSTSFHGVNKFRSAFHKTHFTDFISEKKIVSERALVLEGKRALVLEGNQFMEMQDMIARRGWSKLASFPKPASTLLVKEFFANAYEEDDGKDGDQDKEPKFISYVRGKQVVYDPKTINELFDLEDFPHCDFVAREKAGANADYDGTLGTLCIVGADSETKQTDPKKLHTSDLKSEVKCWSEFVLRTLLPCSSNVSELNLKRVNLLVSILKGENINVRRLLAHNLYETAQSKSPESDLNHPALISLLCERVGVIAKKNEPVIKPSYPINAIWIRKISREAALPAPQRDSPDATLPPENHQEPLGEHSLEERVHGMEIKLESILVNQNKIMAMLQILMEGQNQSQQPQVGEIRAYRN